MLLDLDDIEAAKPHVERVWPGRTVNAQSLVAAGWTRRPGGGPWETLVYESPCKLYTLHCVKCGPTVSVFLRGV